MSAFTLTFQSKKFYSVRPCQTVGVCLDDDGLTSSGLPIATATIVNTGRYLGSAGQGFNPAVDNPRDQEMYQYELSFDDAQFTENPTCANIVDIIENGCLVSILEGLASRITALE